MDNCERTEYDKEAPQRKNETWGILKTKQVSIPDLTSIEKHALQIYFQTFAHKEFMLHQAQELTPHPVWNAYHNEEKSS